MMALVFTEFPCRYNQIQVLDSYLGCPEELSPEAIFVHGPPAVGKSSIVLRYLTVTKTHFAFINCIECYTIRILLDTISRNLLKQNEQPKCENFSDLIYLLKNAFLSGYFGKRKICIVLDGFEYLFSFSDSIVEAFISLQEFTSIHSLTVIFISHILPEKFILKSSVIKIHFPQYSKDELVQVLLKEKPSSLSDHFYKNFLNSALSVFLRATRDLNEMKSWVLSHVDKYCEPLKDEVTDVNCLWRHIVPHLRMSLNFIYLGMGMIVEEPGREKANESLIGNALHVFDLPYYAKYFLIAAYLASYNSPKHDKKLFVKQSAGSKRKTNRIDTKRKVFPELLGPKSFSLDRLLAIFYSIVDEKTSLTANLMTQISSLVELKVLTKIGDGNLEKPKYKCIAGFQCVDGVARTLGFSLRKYLMIDYKW